MKNRTRQFVIAGLATVALVATGGAVVAATHKTVTVDVDGEIAEVSTFASDVGAVLEARGIELAEHDVAVPGPGESVRHGSHVVVRTAEPVEFVLEGEHQTIWTTSLSGADALEYLAASGRDASLSASRSGPGRAELALPVVSSGPVRVLADDEERELEAGGPMDLDAVLLLAEIRLNPADRVEVSIAQDGVPVVSVTRVTTEEGTRTETIEHDSIERETADLYRGQSRVVSEGSDGERTHTLSQVVVDGEVESAKWVSSEVTVEAEDRVVEIGTAQRPAPQPTRSSPPSSGSSSSGSSGSGSSGSGSSGSSSGGSDSGDSGGSSGEVSGDVWARLAQCESGGNPRAVSPSGTYHGLYQFSVSTWQSVGGSGLPSEASPAEQTQRAQALQARSGWGQWPHCSSVLGLR